MAKNESEKNVKTTKTKVPAEAKADSGTAGGDVQIGIQRRRVLTGTVVSNKMEKTIVVKVDRRVRHELYKKYITKSRRFQAHDEKNDAKIGDIVTVIESRPLSRHKRWALQSIVRRAGQVAKINV